MAMNGGFRMTHPAPTDIKAKRADGVLQITWPDGRVVCYPFKGIRIACACASCVDEFTGKRLLDPASIPDDIGIESMALVGAYAVRIRWTDGHDTGLYTWERLRSISGCGDA